jgi:serine/threonine-protein kinase
MPESERDNAPELPAAARRPPADAGPQVIDLPATFGKYFLTEKLATGGMAEIYLAKIVGPGGFEKQLVIKQIHPKLSGQRHFVDLFVAEAKTLVGLAHGNIVPVYELGVIDDTYFIAMEYIDGPTLYRLTEILRRRSVRMEPPIAAWITARILEGLDYAHRKGDGVIHRDLSPRNVMLSRDGEVKLVDFGIAVTLGTAGDEAAGESAPTGSFPYMSPEQVRKQPLTGQTDLFSVGVLFWEMLVGHRLFARSDPDATLAAVVSGEIALPSADNPDVPSKLDGVVMRALERDTSARWASAGDMLAALQRYLYSLDAPPGPRDIAALVARYCPPETRRLPTHHDLPDGPEATQPRGAGVQVPADEEPARPGPLTAIIPRDSGPARGKRHARARTETFATHVALERILERATAPEPPAPGDDDAHDDRGAARADDLPADRNHQRHHERAETAPMRRRSGSQSAQTPTGAIPAAGTPTTDAQAGGAPTSATPAAGTPTTDAQAGGAPSSGSQPGPADATRHPRAADGPPPVPLPGRLPPSRSLLVLAGIGAAVMAAGSVYVFFDGRGAVEHAESTARRKPPRDPRAVLTADPSAIPLDAARPGPEAVSPADAGSSGSAEIAADPALPPLDAASPPVDAAARVLPAAPGEPHPPARRDAGTRPARPALRGSAAPPSRADLPVRIDAGITHPTGTATLTVGASPWGTVLLDGRKIGRTPIEHLSVPAGRHLIEVTFSGEDPPRTLKYPVELSDGEARDILADFTKP